MPRYVRYKVKVLLAVLIAVLAFSAYLTYFFHDKPLTSSKYVANCEYSQQTDYNYVAFIKPSVLYENRTALLPGETAYRSLIKSLNISLTYNFTSNPPPNYVEITYSVSAVLEAERQWSKQFALTSEKTQNIPKIEETYQLNLTEIEDLIKNIEKETNTRASTYYYKIVPKINLNASINDVPIMEDYTPTLEIKLGPTILEFTGLSQTKPGLIGNYETYETTWNFIGLITTVRNMRYLSYALISFFSCCLILTAWRIRKMPPPKFMDTIKKEYREKIIEISEPLTIELKKTTIKVKSLEDLVKVSNETFKPIMHETTTTNEGKAKRHAFYVLDADIKYELIIEEPEEQQKTTPTKTQTSGQSEKKTP
jgi:hypothetical protein